MNDIDSNKNNKESLFKVYKDKLTGFVSKKPTQNTPPTAPINNQDKTISVQAKTPDPAPQENIFRDPQYANNPPEQSVASPQKDKYPETPPVPPEVKTEKKPIISKDMIGFILKILIIVIATLIVGYVLVNYQAISLRFSYWYNVNIKNNNWTEMHPVELKQATTTAQKLDENYLYIPTLGIQAPVNWGIEEQDINNMLSSGLVHYLSSALPDEANGNITIIGNTSGPIWSSSQYKTIFTLLDKINIDQVITIIYDNNIYSYQVVEINTLSNKQVDLTTGIEDNSYLNLLARYPIGLNWKTLKVKAKLYKIQSNILKSQEDKINSLPENISDVELQPIEVTPTNTAVPVPTNNKIPDPELLPDHFLPSI